MGGVANGGWRDWWYEVDDGGEKLVASSWYRCRGRGKVECRVMPKLNINCGGKRGVPVDGSYVATPILDDDDDDDPVCSCSSAWTGKSEHKRSFDLSAIAIIQISRYIFTSLILFSYSSSLWKINKLASNFKTWQIFWLFFFFFLTGSFSVKCCIVYRKGELPVVYECLYW